MWCILWFLTGRVLRARSTCGAKLSVLIVKYFRPLHIWGPSKGIGTMPIWCRHVSPKLWMLVVECHSDCLTNRPTGTSKSGFQTHILIPSNFWGFLFFALLKNQRYHCAGHWQVLDYLVKTHPEMATVQCPWAFADWRVTDPTFRQICAYHECSMSMMIYHSCRCRSILNTNLSLSLRICIYNYIYLYVYKKYYC